MALKKKKSLKDIAVDNTQITKGTSKEQEVLKTGIPNTHSVKHLCDGTVVGASVGVTLNMKDYNSLRVDCWLTDEVKENETVEQAYERVLGIIDKQLNNTVDAYRD